MYEDYHSNVLPANQNLELVAAYQLEDEEAEKSNTRFGFLGQALTRGFESPQNV